MATGPADADRVLDRLIAEDGPVPLTRALALLRPLARELDRLHARGVSYVGVQPRQVVVKPDGTAALRSAERAGRPDARPVPCTEREGARETPIAAEVRDVDYCSPQLLAGEEPHSSDDLYALGVIAYELLVGRTPFEGPAPAGSEPAGSVGSGRPVSQSVHSPALSPEVERVLFAQLSAAPSARYATALELVRELERAASLGGATSGVSSAGHHASPPIGVLPTRRAVPLGPGTRRLALAEMPDVARVPREPVRPRRVRRTDYPDLGLAGFWVAVLILVLVSVYLLPLYYILFGRH